MKLKKKKKKKLAWNSSSWSLSSIPIAADGSSQNPRIVQSRIRGRLTHWDRHLNDGRRSEVSSTTPVHLGAVTEHLFPFAAVERTSHQ